MLLEPNTALNDHLYGQSSQNVRDDSWRLDELGNSRAARARAGLPPIRQDRRVVPARNRRRSKGSGLLD